METTARVVASAASFSRLATAALPSPTMRAAAKTLFAGNAAAMPKLASIALADPWRVGKDKWAALAKMNTAGAAVALAHQPDAAGAAAVQRVALGHKVAAAGAGLPAGFISAKAAIFTGGQMGRATAATKVLPIVAPGFDVATWGLQPRRTPPASPSPPISPAPSASPMPMAPAVAVGVVEPVSQQGLPGFQTSPPAAVATTEAVTSRPAAPPLGFTSAAAVAPLLHLRDGLSGGELADLLAAVVGLSGAPAALHHLLATGSPAQPLTWGSRFALLDRLLAAHGYGQHQRHEIALCLADAAGPAGGPWVGWGWLAGTDAPPAATGPAINAPAPVAGAWAAVLINGFALAELDRLLVFVGLLESADTKSVAPHSKPAQWVAVREALQGANCISRNNRAWARAILARYGERVGKQRALESPQNHSNDAANHCCQRATLWLTGRQKR